MNDIPICGEMVAVVYTMSHTDVQNVPMTDDELQDFIKTKLCHKLLEEMMRGKFIEFTKQDDPFHWGVKYRARIFVTSDEQVRILRQHIK